MTVHAPRSRHESMHALARATFSFSAVAFVVSLVIVLFVRPPDLVALDPGVPAIELVPATGDSSTVFRLKFNDPTDQFCPGDANAGYSWSTFLAPTSVDIGAVTWGGAVAGFPDFPEWLSGGWAPVLTTSAGSSVAGQVPGLNDGFVSPPVEMDFRSTSRYGALPAGSYQIGAACIKADAGVFTTQKYWTGSITFTDQTGAGPNQFVYDSVTAASATTTTTTTTAPTTTTAAPTTSPTSSAPTTTVSVVTTTTSAPTTSAPTSSTSSTTTTTSTTAPTTTTTLPPPASVPRTPNGCPNGAEPGCLGRDVALPLTDSAVTVNGRGRFSDVRITVNQTANLTRQAISIEWEGAAPTRVLGGGSEFFDNYFQIFQCWGDPETGETGQFADNPGPPPEQCVQGAARGKVSPPDLGVGVLASTRVISLPNFTNYEPDAGYFEPLAQQVWRPFRAVDGTVVDFMIDPTYRPTVGGVYWRNPYFSINTTNEIVVGRTYADRTGTELFDVLTGVESSGLGCGQRVQPVAGGGVKEPQCWLVIVPRGDAVDENAGGFPVWEQQPEQYSVQTSPLSEAAWENRIAVPLDFNPLDSDCSIASVERRIAGSELLVPAVASWQPVLCTTGDLPPYSYAPVADSTARLQLANPTPGSPGLVAVSRPLEATQLRDDNPVVYAPLAASGVTIGFAFERPSFGPGSQLTDYQAIQGSRIQQLNLTPRLVAKLLTQSYQFAQYQGAVPDGYDWLQDNPADLRDDPDFLQFNPEFELLGSVYRRATAGLLMPQTNADYARLVWEWILADPEAAAWLAGDPDEWGMRVNPVYATDPELNPNGLAFGDPPPSLFPKNDPTCFQPDEQFWGTPPQLCGTDWLPYVRSLTEAAQQVAIGTDNARVGVNPFANDPLNYWARVDRQIASRRAMLAVTDTPSATLSGVQMARLSRAGDDGGPGERVFIAPTAVSMAAAVDEMEARTETQVLEPVGDLPPTAYPLTTLTYGAIAPLALDELAREEYAAFITYAATAGQEPGLELGQLPVGYAPLSEELRQVAIDAAVAVEELQPAPETTTSTTTTTTTTTPDTPGATPSSSPPPSAPSGTTTGPSSPVFTPRPPSGSGGGSGGGTSSGGASSGAADSDVPGTDVTATSEPPADEDADGEATVTSEPVEDSSGDVGGLPADSSPGETGTVERPLTPATSMGPSRFAVPSLFGLLMLASLVALEITKRPRRAGGDGSGV